MRLFLPTLIAPTRRLAGLAAVVLIAVTAVLYGIEGAHSNAAANKERFSVGEMATFVFKSDWQPAGDFTFKDADGNERTVADWEGRVVLLNLWATWCAPCRHEMPALDRLQAQLGGDEFEVVALSVDRTGPEAAAKFLDEVEANNLALYIDQTSMAMFELRARGLPATFLIDRQGRIIGRMIGPAEWDSEDAVRLVKAAIDRDIAEPAEGS